MKLYLYNDAIFMIIICFFVEKTLNGSFRNFSLFEKSQNENVSKFEKQFVYIWSFWNSIIIFYIRMSEIMRKNFTPKKSFRIWLIRPKINIFSSRQRSKSNFRLLFKFWIEFFLGEIILNAISLMNDFWPFLRGFSIFSSRQKL